MIFKLLKFNKNYYYNMCSSSYFYKKIINLINNKKNKNKKIIDDNCEYNLINNITNDDLHDRSPLVKEFYF